MTTHPGSRRATAASISLLLLTPLGLLTSAPATASPVASVAGSVVRAAEGDPTPTAGGFAFYKFPVGQSTPGGTETCIGVGQNVTEAPFFSRDDCGFTTFTLSGPAQPGTVVGQFFAEGATTPFATQKAAEDDVENGWQLDLLPAADTPTGPVTLRILVQDRLAGEVAALTHNQLQVTFDEVADSKPGQDVAVTGTVVQVDNDGPLDTSDTGVPATFTLRTALPNGTAAHTQQVTAGDDGTFTATVPGSATQGVSAGPEERFRTVLGIEARDASYTDSDTGVWGARRAGAASVAVVSAPTTLLVENSFVSSVGWVKPGETYPSRLFVKNFTDRAFSSVQVTVPAPDGTAFTQAVPGAGSGTASVAGGAVTWTIPSVAAADADGPTVASLVLESKADSLTEDEQVVWKNLSSTATLTVGGAQVDTARSHGPKVIPPSETYDTARFGDRPFPVVPVDYLERKHQSSNSGAELSKKLNSPDVAGSTFNLFQEMSLGQLFPEGTVPSADIATADFTYANGFPFTGLDPAGTCKGATLSEAAGTPLYPERIKDGFYQLPGTTSYYGDDTYGSAIIPALDPVGATGALFDIDSACGPAGKLVYDAAAIADPEIDYSDYDTDKDGVVDFFMVVFAGCGGNGASQVPTACPYSTESYDNVWPHSSSLEFYYSDEQTGLPGFTTDDQLKDLEGKPLFYTDDTYSKMTTTVTPYKVFVRVGPYNVNPETAIDKASVISHEYGHSLGLPDFYSTGGRETYGDWNLMATDKSQHMDVFSRQEMGWVVPEVLGQGETKVTGWTDSKQDTHKIVWQTPDGDPYTLTGPDVHNSQAYVAKLPGRRLIDEAKFDTGAKASKTHAWWSGSGNDFGCAPEGGRNLDVVVPGLADLPEGTTVKLAMKSLFDIEWDYDYGFVLTSTDGGQTYTSQESENGTTTPAASNPNQNGCQTKYGNGITGSSGSYDAGSEQVDRLTSTYPDSVFLADQFDISELAGQEKGVIRFSYATDPGLARPGWFVDDLVVTATLPSGEEVLLSTDLESTGGPEDPHFYNGGCREGLAVATRCTKGWNYVDASSESPADHAYYLEMRDRSGFDLDGRGEVDRDPIAFAPGLSLVYTDEAHGYGNAGTDNPPAQSPLDSTPEPGNDTPDLSDAAFTAAAGKSRFSDSGEGHTDNYSDPAQTDVDPRYADVANPWRFRYGCLDFQVTRLAGTGIGPVGADGDLTGDVTFDVGAGCGEFDYGYTEDTPAPNAKPSATAEASPNPARTGQRVYLDATGTTDPESSADDLDYSWDTDGDGRKDASGVIARTVYDRPGTYEATVTVTDPQGATDTATVEVVVTQGPTKVRCESSAVDRSGSWRTVGAQRARGDRYCDNLGKGSGKDVLTVRFTGSRFALHFARAAAGGRAKVVVDGRTVGALKFRGDSRKPRFGYYRRFEGIGRGTHVARIRVAERAAFIDDIEIWGRLLP